MIVSEPVIRMENIIKRYYIGKPNELQILNGISLSVDQGEFVSIVGESGSWKKYIDEYYRRPGPPDRGNLLSGGKRCK